MADADREFALRGDFGLHRDDQVLLVALAEGHDHAFDLLVARYGQRVQSYVYQIVRDAAWAEDLTQEVFVKVFRKIGTHDPEFSFAVWLFRIARNESLSFVRRKSVQVRAMELLRAGCDAMAGFVPRRAPRGPLAELELGELTARLDAAIATLPEGQRSVFVLREHQGMSYLEIAEIVGCPSKTVSTRLARARAHLREQLADYFDEPTRLGGGR